MIIDAHVHLGTTGNKPKQTPEELLKNMDLAGVDKAVVFPFTEGSFTNEEILEFTTKYPERLIPFCSINPYDGQVAFDHLEDCLKNKGFKGIKLHPQGLGYALSDRKCTDPIFELLQKYNRPAIVHGAGDLLNNPLEFDRVCRRFPKVNVMMAHSGYFWCVAQAVEVGAENDNLFLELSRIPMFEVNYILKKLPASKVIWGTDSPFAEYKIECDKMKLANLDSQEYDLVMGGNLLQLL